MVAEFETKARIAVDYARSIIQFSCSSMDSDKAQIKAYSGKVSAVQSGALSTEEGLKNLFLADNPSNSTALHRIKYVAKRTKEMHAGNCHEYALLVLNKLHKLGVYQAENVVITDGDHSFVVVNRLANSDINDPNTWGPDALVVDAWAMRKSDEELPSEQKYQNVIYRAANITDHLKCYRNENDENIFTPYDPQKNHLQTVISLSSNEEASKRSTLQSTALKLEVLKQVITNVIAPRANCEIIFLSIQSILAMLNHPEAWLQMSSSELDLDSRLSKLMQQILKESLVLADKLTIKELFQDALFKAMASTVPNKNIWHALMTYPNEALQPMLEVVAPARFNEILKKEKPPFGIYDLFIFALEARDDNYFNLLAMCFNEDTLQYMVEHHNLLVLEAILKRLNAKTLNGLLSQLTDDALNNLLESNNDKFLKAIISSWHSECLHNVLPRLDNKNLIRLVTLLLSTADYIKIKIFYQEAVAKIQQQAELANAYGIVFRKMDARLNGLLFDELGLASTFGEALPNNYYYVHRKKVSEKISDFYQMDSNDVFVSAEKSTIIEMLTDVLMAIGRQEQACLLKPIETIIDEVMQKQDYIKLKDNFGLQKFFRELTELRPPSPSASLEMLMQL